MMPLVVFLVTFPDEETALSISNTVVDEGLAACVLRVPVKSVYDWKGNREEDSEAMVLFKTSNEKAEELRNHIEGSHPNQLPAILQLEADAGAAYEEWARQQTSSLINEQAEDETVGSSTNHITDIFGGQARQVNVEETDLSEAEAIAYIRS